jgi:hypothetical protein
VMPTPDSDWHFHSAGLPVRHLESSPESDQPEGDVAYVSIQMGLLTQPFLFGNRSSPQQSAC